MHSETNDYAMVDPHYSLLIVSGIPMECRHTDWFSLDLWVRDLIWQAKVVSKLCVLAPVACVRDRSLSEVPHSIRVVSREDVTSHSELAKLISQYDVVQVGGGVSSRIQACARNCSPEGSTGRSAREIGN